jgi:hypothetical protein
MMRMVHPVELFASKLAPAWIPEISYSELPGVTCHEKLATAMLMAACRDVSGKNACHSHWFTRVP